LPLTAFVTTNSIIGLRFRSASLFRMCAIVRSAFENVMIVITVAFALAAQSWPTYKSGSEGYDDHGACCTRF
jgi:hypothetical protein